VIDRAIDNFSYKLLEEFAVVALVCLIFLWHLRSSLVAIITPAPGHPDGLHRHALPGHQCQHHVARRDRIAIGAMVDAAVVMIENAHKHIEAWKARPREPLQGEGALAGDRRSCGRGRAGAVLQPLIITLSSSRSSPGGPGGVACLARWHSPRPMPWLPLLASRSPWYRC
jgi:Cu(I)/Ag(I) efflux system membrane protein CusA/SilA